VNLEHLRAFLWLRWRLRVNQVKRSGALNAAIMAVIAVGALVVAVGGLVVGFLVGFYAVAGATPALELYVWDGLVLAFVFSWSMGVLADVQRAEALSLDKFLHLPVSPAGAFLINYLSSFLSLSLIVFIPPMIGLTLGQAIRAGAASLLALPLIGVFIFATTAVTYQFQGWLASLMSNPRRRRTVIVFLTAGFILLFQLPNILNLTLRPFDHTQDSAEQIAKSQELSRALAAEEITPLEFDQRAQEINSEAEARRQEQSTRIEARFQRIAYQANLVVPLGWLPMGATGLVAGDFLPALLGGFGLAAIGSASLWRAYRTTLRLYQGYSAEGMGAKAIGKTGNGAPNQLSVPSRPLFVERVLPRVSEYASAVATAGFRSLIRAPEVKMMLLMPIILAGVCGSMILNFQGTVPERARPPIASAAALLALLSSVQFIGNQFGFDRNGFRAYVLCPAPRREILLGKNLAMAPFALGPAVLLIIAIECVFPMRMDHLLGVFVQLLSMFLLLCLVANRMSIAAPMAIHSGSFRPSRVKIGPALLQLAFFMIFPFVLIPTMIPLGADVLLAEFSGTDGWPIGLALSVAMFALVLWLYRRALAWEGELLSRDEHAILEVVTAKEE
jgi:ABC-2 type transport system permease protein